MVLQRSEGEKINDMLKDDNDTWVTEPHGLKEMVTNFYRELYSDEKMVPFLSSL